MRLLPFVRVLAVMLLLVSVAGCFPSRRESPNTETPLQTDRTSYAPGGEVELTLRNVFEHPIGYNLCSSRLQREEEDGEWIMVLENRVCTRELRILEPGKTDRYRMTLPVHAPAGVYRYTTYAGAPGPDDRSEHDPLLATAAFRIEEAGR